MADRKQNATDATKATNVAHPSPPSYWSPATTAPHRAASAAGQTAPDEKGGPA